MKRPSLLLAPLVLGGCMIPLGTVGPVTDKPATPTPPPIAPVVAGVPVGGTGTTGGATVLRAKQSSVELGLGEDRPLGALVVDGNGLVQTTGVIWVSTNPSVLAVNPTSGEAKALAAGTAVVVATSQANPSAQAQIEVKVTEKQLVKQIVVDPANPRLEDGGKASLTAQVYMADGTINGNVKWASSDETIATVTDDGVVRARKEGKVTIEAIYALDPRFKGIAVLTIGNPPATTTPATGGTAVTPGTAPGEEIVPAAPKGKWVTQALEQTAIRGVWFKDAQNGLLNDETGLYATADAGTTWTLKAPADPAQRFEPGQLTWLGDGTILGTYYNAIYRSTDGGATWTSVKLDIPAQPNYTTPGVSGVHAVGPSEAYATIADREPYRYFAAMVWHTTDGGATWAKETIELAQKKNVVDMAVVDGVRVALTEGGLLRFDPAEGGWTPVEVQIAGSTPFGSSVIGALAVVPGTSTIFAAGQQALMRSDDAGKTWNTLGNPIQNAEHLSFADALHGLAATANAAYTTNDGGKTWDLGQGTEKPAMPRDGSAVRGVGRLSEARGYAISNAGKLLRFVYP